MAYLRRIPARLLGRSSLWLLACSISLLLAAVATAGTDASAQLRLIMVEEPGCRFCAQWNADVGTSYPTSEEGRLAPLLRVRRAADELDGLKPVPFTPTFILVMGGSEVGRITGYPGATWFWEELEILLAKAGHRAPAPATARSD